MSYGETLLEQYLHLMVRHPFERNARPVWCAGLELDFYFPTVGVAIEFQGDQHYRPVNFNDPDNSTTAASVIAFNRQRANDKAKYQLCCANNVKLYRIDAVSLEYSALRGKLKKACKRFMCKHLLKQNRDALRQLNKAAKDYRALLRKKFDSVSVRRKGASRMRTIARHVDGSMLRSLGIFIPPNP